MVLYPGPGFRLLAGDDGPNYPGKGGVWRLAPRVECHAIRAL